MSDIVSKDVQDKFTKEELNDPRLPKVIFFVKEEGEVSASRLQREFMFGHEEALRYLDLLERLQVVGVKEGATIQDFESLDALPKELMDKVKEEGFAKLR